MKLSDLKTGMWTRTRKKGMYLVLADFETEHYGKGAMFDEEGFMAFENYDNDMKCITDNSYDIIEVLEADIDCHVLSQTDLFSIWKEKPIPKLTSLEMEFLKALRPIYKKGWIAEDKCGEIWIYETKPVKEVGIWAGYGHVEEISFTRNIFTEILFKWLTWEDEEPCYIPDLIKGNKENE